MPFSVLRHHYLLSPVSFKVHWDRVRLGNLPYLTHLEEKRTLVKPALMNTGYETGSMNDILLISRASVLSSLSFFTTIQDFTSRAHGYRRLNFKSFQPSKFYLLRIVILTSEMQYAVRLDTKRGTKYPQQKDRQEMAQDWANRHKDFVYKLNKIGYNTYS